MKKYVKKLLLIILGSIISAYGITLAIHAGFGGATLAVLWQGVANLVHISLGSASLIVAIIMIVFVFFYDRKQIFIGTVLYQLIYSLMVDVFSKLIFYSDKQWINFVLMLLGIVLFAIGTGIYSSTNMGRGAYEAVTFSINSHTGWQIQYIRIVSDITVVILGVIMGGHTGLCTIATIIMSGPIIQRTIKIMNKINKTA